MRKITYLLILLILIITPACSSAEKNPYIGEPMTAKSVDKKTSKPIEVSSIFNQSDTVIYFSVKTQDLPKNTKLKAVWKYLGDGTEISSEILTEGTGYEVFTLKRGSSQFPAGEYEVTVTAPAEENTLETKGKFSVIADTKPVHLLNPITSKSIDNNEALNPSDITSQFPDTQPLIYFVFQSRDLPQNSKVSCIWYFTDTGDSLSNELITDGSRNIAFTLKPDEGKTLPKGKYIVTASVNIGGEIESISKEFEITGSIE